MRDFKEKNVASIFNLSDFGHFLENTVLNETVLSVKEITCGGTSYNFMVRTSAAKYIAKAISVEDMPRVQRLCSIYKTLESHSHFLTARAVFETAEPLVYQGYAILFSNFISGQKLKYFQLKPEVVAPMCETYKQFQKLSLNQYGLSYEHRHLGDLFAENEEALSQICARKSSYARRVGEKLRNIQQKILNRTPHLAVPETLIHGDASLNNIIYCPNGQIAFLDLELIRYGYPVEDAAELILSALLPHHIFFTPEARLKALISEFNKYAAFSKEEWIYGVCSHFLFFIKRRLRGNKLFRSYRKDWLFFRYLKKFDDIINLLENEF